LIGYCYNDSYIIFFIFIMGNFDLLRNVMISSMYVKLIGGTGG